MQTVRPAVESIRRLAARKTPDFDLDQKAGLTLNLNALPDRFHFAPPLYFILFRLSDWQSTGLCIVEQDGRFFGFDGIRSNMAKAGFAGRLTALVGRFRSNSSGDIAVIFAIALVPILSAIGCAVDYSTAARMKAKMQSAADAAAVASISQNSAGFLVASIMTSNGSVAAGVTDANNIFNGNLGAVTGYSNL